MAAPTEPARRRRERPGPPPALALAVVLLGCLPFLGRAFHIDDVAFLTVARNVLAHPLEPFSGASALDGRDLEVFAALGREPSTFEAFSHPPLVAYALALASLPFGFREVPLHAAFALFPLLAALAAFRLAERFTRAPVFATLLVISCPIFLLCSHSLMTDLPALALSLLALSTYLRAADAGDRSGLLWAGVLAGLAFLTRYAALSAAALFLADAVVRRRPRALGPAFAGLAVVAVAWCLQNWLCCGELHVVASSSHYARYYEGRAHLGEKAVSDLAGLGGTALLPCALLLGTLPRRRALTLSAAAAALAAWLCLSDAFGLAQLREYSPGQMAALVASLAAGLVLVSAAGLEGLRAGDGRQDRLFLFAWLLITLAGAVVVLPFGTARYMLPVLPPLFLLLTRGAELQGARRWGAGVAIVGTLALGLSLAAADAEYAEVYRRFASTPRATGARTWFVGDWGFRYYMEATGARYLTAFDDRPAAGDVVVRPRVAANHELAPALRPRLERVATLEVPGRSPLRIMSFPAKAGFYSHAWGYLPFSLSQAPLETFDVYRVTAPR